MKNIATILTAFLLAHATAFAQFSVPTPPDGETIPLEANFTYNANCLAVFFENTSSNGIAYTWDFGTGDSSYQENPFYVYSAPGEYHVTLTALSSFGNVVSITKPVVADDCTGLEDKNGGISITLSPNPAHGFVNLQLSGITPDELRQCRFELFNASGQRLEVRNHLTQSNLLSLPELAPGIYFISITNGGKLVYSQKLFVN